MTLAGWILIGGGSGFVIGLLIGTLNGQPLLGIVAGVTTGLLVFSSFLERRFR